MLALVPLVTTIAPSKWFVAFRRTSPLQWVQRWVPGEFKHVCCYGFVPGLDVWVFVHPSLNDIGLFLVPDFASDLYIKRANEDAVVVEFVPPIVNRRRWWKPSLLCTGIVAGVIGARSSALRPDRLLRDLLREHAEIVFGEVSGLHRGTPAGE